MQYPHLILKDIPNLDNIDVYIANGGFESLKKALKLTSDEVIGEVKKSGLRGRGGACFPTGLKWSFMPKGSMTKYLAVNGDESEPGSFKDRQIFERNPFQLIEGILIASYAMGIKASYLYIRGEYKKQYGMMEKAIAVAYERGFLGEGMKKTFGTAFSTDIYLHLGAGAYVCGEETAQMNSEEGLRPYPRIKPPFPANKGLWGQPTTVNNVETLATVPAIFEIGADAYSHIGAPGHCGTLLFGVSGNIENPGVYELPTGTPLKTIIYDICGGIPNGKKLKAVIPGGSSMPPLNAADVETARMDENSLQAFGTHIGTGGIIVMDEDADLVKIAYRIAQFYHNESCGQCTPCRVGTGWMVKILKRLNEGNAVKSDIDLLISVAENIEGRTVCALGDAAAWAPKGFAKKFRSEFESRCKQELVRVPENTVTGKVLSKEMLAETVS